MTKTRSRRSLHPLAVAGLTLLLAIAYGCFFAARWFVTVYGRIGFDSILFTLQSSLDGVQSDLVKSFLLRGALPTVVCTCLSCAILLMVLNEFWVMPAKTLALVSLIVYLLIKLISLPGLMMFFSMQRLSPFHSFLYLCGQEIIPLLLLGKGMVLLSHITII